MPYSIARIQKTLYRGETPAKKNLGYLVLAFDLHKKHFQLRCR
jgi:hypothetical protein